MSFYYKEELICLFHFFIQPFFYITVDSWILVLFHGLESVIIIIHFYCSNSLDLDFENPFKLAHVSFWHTPITLWELFTFWYNKILQTHLYFLCLRPFNQLSLLGSLYWIMIFRNQDLDAKCAHYYWGVFACGFFWLTEPGNTYMYTHTCKHTFITICISVWMCIEIWINTETTNSN